MKYEKLHGYVFRCIECGEPGRWLWWWNRRNGMPSHFKRMCKSCGRKSGYKFLGNNINGINHGGGKSGKIYLLSRRG